MSIREWASAVAAPLNPARIGAAEKVPATSAEYCENVRHESCRWLARSVGVTIGYRTTPSDVQARLQGVLSRGGPDDVRLLRVDGSPLALPKPPDHANLGRRDRRT